MRKRLLTIWSILLVLVVSLAVLVPGCDGNGDGADTYALTMAADPVACGTATDLTDASPYAANATVNIKAVAASCCQFVDWMAPEGTFGNATAAETTFTMPARNVTVTANFEPIPLDHFKCYWTGGMPLGEEVQLEDQFHEFGINATVGEPYLFGNPAEKMHDDVTTPISDPDNHFTWYNIYYKEEPQTWEVTVKNQFGPNQLLIVGGPLYLAVPTQKGDHDPPECLDHFLVYYVLSWENVPEEEQVLLVDQFNWPEGQMVWRGAPEYFANPVQKTHDGKVTGIENPDDHLVCYRIDSGLFDTEVSVVNQFGPQLLNVYQSGDYDILAVPSVKIDWAPYTPP